MKKKIIEKFFVVQYLFVTPDHIGFKGTYDKYAPLHVGWVHRTLGEHCTVSQKQEFFCLKVPSFMFISVVRFC